MEHAATQSQVQAQRGAGARPPFWGRFVRGSLLVRFSLLSLVTLTLIAGGLVWVLQSEIEHNALVQQADEVAVVVDGMLGRHLRATDVVDAQHPAQRARWESLAQALLQGDPHLVRIKVWDTSGRVVYSNNVGQIGQIFPIDTNLRTALSGVRTMDVSDLTESENVADRVGHAMLLETYIPMRAGTHVIGAYEAYSDLSDLDRQVGEARRTIWGTVAVGFLLLYASLFAIVRQASRRLVRQVQEIALLGEQAREAETLRQVDQLKDEFIGTVSHELRRPLASIKGYTSSLLLRDADWDAALQREFLQVIDEESDHLAALIDNLLDLARLGSGSLSLTREPVYLPVLTEQIVRRVRAQTQLPAHPYEVCFPPQFPTIDADSVRMTQVILNLLENAAKYAPAGSPIVIEGALDGSMVSLRVRDRGPGLTPEQAARIFDKFYRVESGLTRATEGSGLGLAICRGVVEAHGGHISVETVLGQGCTFTVCLPAGTPVEAGLMAGTAPTKGTASSVHDPRESGTHPGAQR